VPTVYALKPRFQAALRPFVSRLAAAGITANQVTVAAAAGSLAIGLLVATSVEQRTMFLLLPLWLLARMALNAIDGMLAREFRQQSRLGAYLNELGDVASDASLYAPFAYVPPFGAWGVGTVIVLAALSEFAGALGPMIGVSRHYDGPMGKSDRAVVFGVLGLWLGLGGTLPGWLGGLMPVIAGLLVLAIVNRVRGGLGEASAQDIAATAPINPAAPASSLRVVEERSFRTTDGTELFYRFWAAQSATPRGAVVLFHRGHEHSGRMAHLADELDLPDFAIFAWDARGHGRSRGEVGNSAALATSVRDVQDFIDHLRDRHGGFRDCRAERRRSPSGGLGA